MYVRPRGMCDAVVVIQARYTQQEYPKSQSWTTQEMLLILIQLLKKKPGLQFKNGVPGNPDQSYTITLNKLEKLDAIYGNIGQTRDGEMYIKEQIQSQA